MKRDRGVQHVIVALDEEAFAKARRRAAERSLSLPGFIAELVRRELRQNDDYEVAYRSWRAAKPFALKGPPQPYPNREELHDRAVFRRH